MLKMKFKAEFMAMTKEQRQTVIESLVKSVEHQEVYENCTCGAECENRIFIARYENLAIMECLECGKIQVVYR